jgi:Zn-dependent protease with chaperone function
LHDDRVVIEFEATLFDGKTSARRPVHVRAEDGILQISGEDFLSTAPLAEVRVDPRIADIPRNLALPGGASLQTDDHDAMTALFPRANGLEVLVQGMERRWPFALAGLVATALLSWWFVVQGLPKLANRLAQHVPVSAESALGEQTLRVLDAQFCEPSMLPPERQQALQTALFTLADGLNDGYAYRIALRSCRPLGANAFAMPGGVIVVTDDLAKLGNDLQVSAVLAHEIGHVRLRHGLRTAFQGAGIAILVATLAGDALSVTGLAATLPTLLLQTGYSREFETEADDYAFARLKEKGQSPKQFAEMMTLLEADYAKRNKQSAHPGGVMDYVSTHPVTADRIARALASQ